MSSKIARGSLIMLIGYFIFRVGGYIYRFVTANLLGPAGFGILNLALPTQSILIQIASGGMPPAIAKHVSEYSAQGDEEMVKQVIHTSLKIVIVLGLFFSLIIFLLADPLAYGYFHKPEAALPLKLVALITPFSVVVGVFRGAFQGVFQMGNIVITKAFEQVFMISSAIILIWVGFQVAGAVTGTAIGFLFSALAGYYLYRRGLGKRLKDVKLSFTLKQELSLAKVLIIFALPVLITGLAETALFDAIGNFIVGRYLASEQLGFYGAATPVARLPLIISMSVATAVLPATAEAMGLKNRHVLKGYVNQSYRYVSLVVLPMCVGTFVFATPIMKLLYVNSAYMNGAAALQLLSIGMLFFTIYTVSSSIAQGLGKPYLPMVILIAGVILDVALSMYLVPLYGITGAAAATTITALFIMSTIVWKTLQVADVKLEYKDLGRIVLAAGIMGAVLLLIPQSLLISSATLSSSLSNSITFFSKYFVFLLVMILAATVYVVALILVGGLKNSDISAIRKLSNKTGPLKGKLEKIISFIERFAH
ncbi:oligosaccharide flippase family protein [Methanobacterium subterraneum]|jgi:stage V sporulation protein B|uniref:Oligosaccharide flippase family protein n=1 Tax=Methanobacterium subterraneum TaxID=59277 RepID=A0A2H4VF08_9EURY|nr:oligosaccharide flippase family protein [Methanobacterium subterraneum]AUB56630.1 polysaccharide biosynthesis protein [Methanobacterium subterraneum]NMO09581.1 oligosaccharide flippase family protein [Methanobacterium subterraneum]PKL71576.1 MAG: polysaccharide biosynthesis protein [Methanobacteriales archaeon HGW-Methanobacteriales-2]